MKVAELLKSAQHAIQHSLQFSKKEATLEAQILLQHVLEVNRAWLLAHNSDVVEQHEQLAFEVLVKRRLDGEPIAYIMGEREFYGIKLKVTPDTLIPRPDTETLVEAALTKIPANETSNILDLGTGTGAIALAIARSREKSCVTATDASKDTLKVAEENAQNLGIQNTTLILSNWFDALHNQTFDVIVSNPPYVENEDLHLIQGDLRFEPREALASGKDGLNDIRQIIEQAPKHLTPNGWLMLEHGYNQAEDVTALLIKASFSATETIKDLGGNERVTIGRYK